MLLSLPCDNGNNCRPKDDNCWRIMCNLKTHLEDFHVFHFSPAFAVDALWQIPALHKLHDKSNGVFVTKAGTQNLHNVLMMKPACEFNFILQCLLHGFAVDFKNLQLWTEARNEWWLQPWSAYYWDSSELQPYRWRCLSNGCTCWLCNALHRKQCTTRIFLHHQLYSQLAVSQENYSTGDWPL